MRHILSNLIFLWVMGLSLAAFGQDATVEKARQQFDAAQRSFAAGDFAGCARDFLAAHATKAFPAFLFNAAVCQEKAGQFAESAATFARYLVDSPQAVDKADVEKRMAALQQKAGADPAVPSQALPEMKPKGMVSVKSTPTGAKVYIDKVAGEPVGETEWQGSLEGKHTIILVAPGYETLRHPVEPRSDKWIQFEGAMKPDEKLGWLEVSANIPGAAVYIDRKDIGAVGKTPFRNNVEKGKHTLYVEKEGYEGATRAIEVKAGEVNKVEFTLEQARVGFVVVRANVIGASVELDGHSIVACPKAPCRFSAKEGRHELSVDARGKKEFAKDITVQMQTETIIRVDLADSPSRWDAGVQFLLAGGLAVGGYLIYKNADEWGSKGTPPEDRFPGGPTTVKVTAGVVWAVGAFALGRGVYFLVRDKGPPSTGTIDARELSWEPVVAPGYAGLSATLRF